MERASEAGGGRDRRIRKCGGHACRTDVKREEVMGAQEVWRQDTRRDSSIVFCQANSVTFLQRMPEATSPVA